MNNTKIKNGSDFTVHKETVQLCGAEIEVQLVSACIDGELCSPEPEFEMIERCGKCGKLI